MRLNTCPGLATRCARPAQEPHQRVLAGPVDAGEPQDRDRQVAPRPERAPGLLGVEARWPRRAWAAMVGAVSSIHAPP